MHGSWDRGTCIDHHDWTLVEGGTLHLPDCLGLGLAPIYVFENGRGRKRRWVWYISINREEIMERA
jgi:hypothetical protein